MTNPQTNKAPLTGDGTVSETLIEVTQDDREAAADYTRERHDDEDLARMILAGEADGCMTVSHFARHRLATEARLAVSQENVERVARAICEASSQLWREGHYVAGGFHNADELNNHWRYKARAAIAALSEDR